MPSKPSPNDAHEMIKSVEALPSIRKLSAMFKMLNHMISWCRINQNNIHSDPAVVAKFDKKVVQRLEKYRDDVYDQIEDLKQYMVCAMESSKVGLESEEFMNVEKRTSELQRVLERMLDSSGRYTQPLVTRWFHEDDYFTITDVEVEGSGYNFDLGVADKHGDEYDVEIWNGQSKHHHATRETTTIMGCYQGNVHSYPGGVPSHLSDVASDNGAFSLDSKHDLPKVLDKLNNLRDNHAGFLIACRQGPRSNFSAALWGTDFPIVPLGLISPNKCIIVLNVSNSAAFGERDTAFVVHHPAFRPVEVARKMIQSLGFKHDQDIYARKTQLFKQFNLV